MAPTIQHPECSYMPSNHLWFLVLTEKKENPLPFLVVWWGASWNAVIYLLCLIAVLIAWGASLHHNCLGTIVILLAEDLISLCFTDIQSVGTFPLSLSLCLFFKILARPSFLWCLFVEIQTLQQTKKASKNLILSKRALSCSAVSKLSAWLISFNLLHSILSR